MSSSVKGRLPSKVVFCQRLSSVKSCLPSKVVFHRRSSSSFGSFSFLGFSPECGIAKLSLSERKKNKILTCMSRAYSVSASQKGKKIFTLSNVLIKVIRAKLTGNWKVGGNSEKTLKTMNFLTRGTFGRLSPWGIGLTSVSNLLKGPYIHFPIMDKLHLTYVSILHDMIHTLKFLCKELVCGGGDV